MTECQDGNGIFKANPCSLIAKKLSSNIMIRTTMKGCKIIAVKYSQENIKTHQKSALMTDD